MVGSFKLKEYSWSILKKSVFLREKGEEGDDEIVHGSQQNS